MDVRWQIANEARSAELAIIFSYLTSASGIIVLLKTLTKYMYDMKYLRQCYGSLVHFMKIFQILHLKVDLKRRNYF